MPISEAIADPYSNLTFSAKSILPLNPIAISFVIWADPTGRTQLWTILPSSKTAILTVPPPKSKAKTPNSFWRLFKAAWLEAKETATMPSLSNPAPVTHLLMFLI